jgi:hypothetical protein
MLALQKDMGIDSSLFTDASLPSSSELHQASNEPMSGSSWLTLIGTSNANFIH